MGAGTGASGELGSVAGHFFAAARIDCFRPAEEVKAEMDAFLDQMTSTPPVELADGSNEPVIYAGIKEAAARADRLEHGIPLHPQVLEYLDGLAEKLGVEIPAWEATS